MREIEIRCIDPIYCKIRDKDDRNIVAEILSYESEKWSQGPFAMQKEMLQRSYLDRRNGEFLAGFLPKVIMQLEKKGYFVKVKDRNEDYWTPVNRPSLPGMEPREDQLQLLAKIGEGQRGYIKAATGTGKTVVAGFTHSMFWGARTLFLCHTTDLLNQSAAEFRKWEIPTVVIGGGKKASLENLKPNQIVVATIQTFSKLPNIMDHVDLFDVIIIDECHHIKKKDGMYARILERSLAPVRIGLTATDENANAFLEGYLGPKLGEFSILEGIKSGVLAEPEIHLINVPMDDDLLNIKEYKNIYQKCVVENRARNRLVMSEVKKELMKGHSVLTLIQNVKHGQNLIEMGKILNIPTEFVWGGTKKDERQRMKEALESKDCRHVIASCVWNEGINIRTLDCVNNAAGGRNETRTLQKIGRGLRTTDTKKKVIIKDYLDGYNYLSKHAILRLMVYVEFGWTMKGVK